MPRNLSGSYLETTPVKQVACTFKSTPFVLLTPRKLILLFLEVTGKHKHIKKPIFVPSNLSGSYLEHPSLFPIVVPRKQIFSILEY